MSNPNPNNKLETIRLNCFILGGGISFHIDIAPTEKIFALTRAIKDECKDEFANVGSAEILLWKVDLPLDEESKYSLEIDLSKRFFSFHSLDNIFGTPANDRLHVVVMLKFIHLNCFILGDSISFYIDIKSTESVFALLHAIRDKYEGVFAGIRAVEIMLWKVDLPLNEESKHSLRSFTIDPSTSLVLFEPLKDIFSTIAANDRLHVVVLPGLCLNCLVSGQGLRNIFSISFIPTHTIFDIIMAIRLKTKKTCPYIDNSMVRVRKVNLPINEELNNIKPYLLESLSPTLNLAAVFTTVPDKNLLHIIVQFPSLDEKKRRQYINKGIGTPSTDGRPSAFAEIQKNEEYLCSRPQSAADAVPVTLLEPIFAEFVDNCQTHRPTSDDNNFVYHLSQNMCSLHARTRISMFEQLLCSIGIYLTGAKGLSTLWTGGVDRYLLSRCKNFPLVIATAKNEIGSDDSSAEPFARSLVSSFLFPCFHIIEFGACIGISGSVFTQKIQSDILVPIIPLFWHSTDSPMQAMAARTFGALRIAIKKLEDLYKQPMPQLALSGCAPVGCPYPREFTEQSTGRIQKFSYDETQIRRDKLIFFGTVEDTGKRICIKFVRDYSPEAHRFCAEKGHAPELIAYEPLAGGWNMVVMEVIDTDSNGSGLYYTQLYRMKIQDRQPLKGPMTSLIEALHNHCGTGYVHGDIRDVNFLVRNDMANFMLIDFDWAGPVGQTFYPMLVNCWGVKRPDDAKDGLVIKPEHDMEMLEYIFDYAEHPVKHLRLTY